MHPQDEMAIAGLFNSDGQLYARTAETGWRAAERVELKAGNLLIWWYPERGEQRLTEVYPPKLLLEKFLSLADASDKQIHQFVLRYGDIGPFSYPGFMAFDDRRARPRVGFCEVYRYFARVMMSLLKLAAQLHESRPGAPSDWATIGSYPKIMVRVAERLGRSKHWSVDHEELWLLIASLHRDDSVIARGHKDIDIEKMHLGGTLDHLLNLADARVHFKWQSAETANPNPHLFYRNESLFQYLVHQLCMAVARVPAFVVCTSCNSQYIPLKRAPKKGQRNFCPQCRKDSIPKKLALKRFREKQRA